MTEKTDRTTHATIDKLPTCAYLGRRLGLLTLSDGSTADLHECQYPGLRQCYPSGHPTARSCQSCQHHTTTPPPDLDLPRVDVVITSHNYGRYVEEAITSARSQHAQGTIIVVDDASEPTDATRQICEQQRVQYLRVEHRSAHLARRDGFALCKSPLVCFLDADNRLEADYLLNAARLFKASRRLAIVYADLQYFGDKSNRRSVPEATRASIENQNSIDTGSVWLAQAIRQAQLWDHVPHEFCDWWMARQIIRSGAWETEKNPVALAYRVHSNQVSHEVKRQTYFHRANCDSETVTIFTTFSQRIQRSPELWDRRKEWLRSQTWPKIRLIVANTSHAPLPANWMDGLPPLAGLSCYDHPVGSPGLELGDRRNNMARERAIHTAVPAIYNRGFREINTELALILEDDVFPQPLDTIERLVKSLDAGVAMVTAAYRLRFNARPFAVWSGMTASGDVIMIGEPGTGVQPIHGCGLGCALLRMSQVSDEPMAGCGPVNLWYDCDWTDRLRKRGHKILINWDVAADHVGEQFPTATHETQPRTAFAPCANLLPQIRTDGCAPCKGGSVEVRGCTQYGECAPRRYRQVRQPHICDRQCQGFAPLTQLQMLK